jgi:hypothetical protein
MTTPSTKEKNIKAWAVLCSNHEKISAWQSKDIAMRHAQLLDNEYGCVHKVVPAKLLILPLRKTATRKQSKSRT